MSQYYGQNSTINKLTGELWSEGVQTYSGDGGDNEIAVPGPGSGYSFAYAHIKFSGSGVATNSYTQFHNSSDSHLSMEYSCRYHRQDGGNSYYVGNSTWQKFADSQDCSTGWLARFWIPVGNYDRVQVSGCISWTYNGVGIAETHGSYQRQGTDNIGKVGVNIDGSGTVTGMHWRVIGYR